MLADLKLTIAMFSASLQKFQRACRAIGGDMKRSGPYMQEFRDGLMDLSLTKGKLADLYHALQRYPDEIIIQDTAESMARDFKQSACMTQINQLTTEGLNAARSLLARAEAQIEIGCTPQSIKSGR